MLRNARPDIAPKCSEVILTLRDPNRDAVFPRQCVIINLGEEIVKTATLEPMVKSTKGETTVVVAHAYHNKSPEEWTANCSDQKAAKQQTVQNKTASVLKCKPDHLEVWGYDYRIDQSWFRICIRVPASKASTLFDLKDPLVFYRPMLRPGEAPPIEDGVTILWSKFATVSALAEKSNTVPGIGGFVANMYSLGVRIATEQVALGRQALQHPNSKITELNRGIAGNLAFAIQGFPVGTSALPGSHPHDEHYQ